MFFAIYFLPQLLNVTNGFDFLFGDAGSAQHKSRELKSARDIIFKKGDVFTKCVAVIMLAIFAEHWHYNLGVIHILEEAKSKHKASQSLRDCISYAEERTRKWNEKSGDIL